MEHITDAARDALRKLVRDLAAGRYGELARDGRVGRLTADELQRAVVEYGRTLVDLPDEAWDLADAYPQGDGTIYVDLPLWTKEEGRSDLTLSATIDAREGMARVSIDDLHVL